jgi:hypothetical protein
LALVLARYTVGMRISSGKVAVAVAAVIAVVLAVGFVLVAFFDVDIFGS